MAKRFLSNINVNDQYTLPAADGATGQVIQTDGAGNLSFVDFASDEARKIVFTVKNKDSISLSKGTVVHASPSANPPSGNIVEVIRADNDDSSKMPAIGVLNETLAVDAEGECVMLGSVSGIATNSFNIGDELYVSDTPGEFTNTKPTGTSNLIQKIAIVIKSHSTNGLIEVFGAGRSNDVPNRIDRNVNFTDDSLLTFGNSTDLRIYHNSSNSSGNIWNTVGHLNIQNTADDSDIVFLSDDGAGGNAEYFRVDGGENRIVYSQSGRHLDNVISMYGSGADLQIKHDGFHSYISNNTGTLYIQQTADDSDIVFQSDNGSGGTSDYMSLDGSATRVNFFVDTRYSDGAKALFGGGGDLQIYHDGSNSYIVDSGTGDLYIRGASSIYIGNSAGTKSYISGTDGGSTNLFYNGSKKLETTSTGVKTTGEIVVDGTTSAFANSGITLKRTGVLTGDADILLAGTSGSEALAFRINDSEKVRIDSSGNLLVSKTSANNATVGNQFMTDGSANPTVDGDTVARFNRLTSDGEIIRLQKDTSTVGSIGSTTSYLNSSLGIGTTSPVGDLTIGRNGNASGGNIMLGSTTNATNKYAVITSQSYNSSTDTEGFAVIATQGISGTNLVTIGGGISEVDSATQMRFYTSSSTGTRTGTERMRITSGGRVGINTTNPTTYFQVNSGTENSVAIFESTDANAHIRVVDINATVRIENNSGKLILGADLDSQQADSYISFEIDGASEKMRIDSQGFVGIGTTSPSYKLDVVSPGWTQARFLSTSSGYAPASILLETNTGSGTSRGQGVFLYSNDSDTTWFSGTAYNDNNENFIIAYKSNTTFNSDVAQKSNALLTINNGGNVGINVSSPSAGLQIALGGTAIPSAGSNTGSVCFGNTTSDDNYGLVMGANSSGVGYISSQRTDGIATTYNLAIQPNGGNVGIGTDDFPYSPKLAVSASSSPKNTFSVQTTDVVQGTTGTIIYVGLGASTGNSTYGSIRALGDGGTAAANLVLNESGGSVGIGTTSPSQKAVISGPNTAPSLNTTAVSSASLLVSNSDTGYGTYFATTAAGIGLIQQRRQTSAVYYDLSLQPYGGDVGIGTLSPTCLFHVQGNPASTGVLGRFYGSGTLGSLIQFDRGSSYNWKAGIGGASSSTPIPSSYFGIAETTQGARLVIAHTTGNVGIGTTSPSQKLHVAGNLRVTGAYYDSNNSSGTADQVLVSTGTGTDWQDLSDISGVDGTGASGQVAVWSDTDTITGYTRFKVYDAGGQIQVTDGTRDIRINSGYGGSTAMIGTVGSHDLGFMTANSQRVTIDSSGSVGIGTTSPSYKLDVEHNSNATNGIQVTNTNSGTSSRATVEFVSEDAQLNIYATSSNYNGVASWADAGVLSTSSATSNGLIFNAQSGGIKFQISTAEKMRIDSSGNVGIGKTPSTWKLDVDSSDIYAASFDTSNNVGIVINGNNTTAAQIIGYSNSASTYNELHLRTNSTTTDGLYINSSGNVGIGTTSPSAKLTINTGTGTDSLRFEKDSQETYRIIHGTSGLYFTHPNSTALLFGLTQNGDITIHNNQSSQYVIFDNGTNSVGIGTTSPTEALDVNGNIKHTGLTMTSGTDVDQVSTFDMTFQLTADTWTDTGIDGTDLGTGTYAIQVYVDDNGASGDHYAEYYSGMMSWYADSTNSTVVDEIPLHRAGHAPNNGNIMLRTQRASGTDTHDLMLQIKHDRTHTLAMNGTDNRTITFKFRRLI